MSNQYKTNIFKILNDTQTVRIYLKSNLCAYVDLADWDKVKGMRWLYHRCKGRTPFVYTIINNRRVTLQRFLFEPTKSERIIFLNSNVLDARRCNVGKIVLNYGNKFEILKNDRVVKVHLDYGQFTYVDMEDWKRLGRYSWGVHNIPNKPQKYVRTVVYMANGTQRCLLMHRMIMAAKTRKMIIHVDSDNFNNRRNNLTVYKSKTQS